MMAVSLIARSVAWSGSIALSCRDKHFSRVIEQFKRGLAERYSCRVFCSRNDEGSNELLQLFKSKAQKLIQVSNGHFSSLDYRQSEKTMQLLKRSQSLDAEAANLSFNLVEKVALEMKESDNHEDGRFILNRSLVYRLIRNWRNTALTTKQTSSPKEIAWKLQAIARMLPEFPFDVRMMSIILTFVTKNEEPRIAPVLAEELLNMMENETDQRCKSRLRPVIVFYNQVLKAWADSGHPNASEKMEIILQNMRQSGIGKSPTTYRILIRFWAGQLDIDMVEKLLQSMKLDGTPPCRLSLSEAIYCYCRKGETKIAQSLLNELLEVEPTCAIDRVLPSRCAQCIMLEFRDIVDSASNENKYRKHRALESAEELYKNFSSLPGIDDESKDKLTGSMMDIYARMHRFDQIQELSQKVELNATTLGILAKALGNTDQADRASDIVKHLLNNPIFCDVVNIRVISTVINAWAESSKPNAFDQALSFSRTVTTEPKYVEMGLRPDAVTYSCLLKCLSQRPREDAGKIVLELIDEMEDNFDHGLVPNVTCYTTGIKVCLQNNLCKIAEALMERMTSAGISPNLRTYIEILNYWSNVRTQESAERVEQIVDYMKELAKSNPELTPNTICYNILLSAWARAKVKISADMMRSIYNEMISNGIQQNTATLKIFARTANRQHIEKADDILSAFEKSSDPDKAPDYRHFSHVINGWLSINDVNRATSVLIRQVDAFVNQKNPDASPDAPTIDKVARGFVKKGDLVTATTLLEKFKKLNDDNVLPVGPSLQSYKYLLSQWKKSPNPEKGYYIRNLEKNIASFKESTGQCFSA